MPKEIFVLKDSKSRLIAGKVRSSEEISISLLNENAFELSYLYQ
jgi:hypothetical protein